MPLAGGECLHRSPGDGRVPPDLLRGSAWAPRKTASCPGARPHPPGARYRRASLRMRPTRVVASGRLRNTVLLV
jgi:hypothetical protein